MRKSVILSAARKFRALPAATGDVFDPNTGEVQAKVALASRADTEQAIANAAAAQPAWAATNPQRRARVMFKFLELIQAEYDNLAKLLSSEHGKTFADATGDIQRGLEVVEFACGIPHLLKGEFTEGAGPGIDLYSVRQPLGVVAGITPFNFPGHDPAVEMRAGDRLRQCVHSQAVRARSVRADADCRTVSGGRACRRASSMSSTATRRPSIRLLTDKRISAIGFVGSSSIAEYIYSTGMRARKARAMFRRRQEPHDRDARRRHGSGGRCIDRRRLRLGRRALHGDLGRRSGRQEDR